METEIETAVFPIAGQGTRLYPLTKNTPKHMLSVSGNPMIYQAIEEARESGIKNFVFIINYSDSISKSYLNATIPEGKIIYDNPLGLGHAVWRARNFINNRPFVVVLPDDFILSDIPCIKQMLMKYNKCQSGNMVAIRTVAQEKQKLYGMVKVVERRKIFHVRKIEEKPLHNNLKSSFGIVGRYVLQPTIFSYLEKYIKTGEKKNKEVGLTEALSASLINEVCYGIPFEGICYDCGNIKGLNIARASSSSINYGVL